MSEEVSERQLLFSVITEFGPHRRDNGVVRQVASCNTLRGNNGGDALSDGEYIN